MTRIYIILITGVLIISSSSILIRWTGDVPFTVIAFYRVFISFWLLLFYQSLLSRKDKSLLRTGRWQYLLAGFFLAAHFITWIASLQMTTIANSIFLESMHPIFGVLVSIIFLKEYPRSNTVPVFIAAFIGIFLIVIMDFEQGGEKLWGDILAIISALCLAFYLMIARIYRKDTNFTIYLIYIYGSAAVFCLIYLIAVGNPIIGFTAQSWIFMVILAIGPNLFGHSILNWASRKIEIFKVNLMLLLEPVFATLTGMIFIAEYPPRNFYIGAGIILISLWYLFYQESRNNTGIKNRGN